MNDYWNDPPEIPDPPKCPSAFCDGMGEYLYEGKSGHVFSCDTCAYQWVMPFDVDPEPKQEEEVYPLDNPLPGVIP